jgi:hypothetical protein
MFDGLKAFTMYWQSNDSIFAILVFIFKSVSGGLATEMVLSNPLPIFLSKVTVVIILAGVLSWLLLKGTSLLHRPVEFVRGLFWLMALVFLLSPVQNSWYLCWVVPFLCVFPQRSWMVLTGLIGFYYLDFYFDYQELQAFSHWIPWVEYLPFYILLGLELRESRKQKRTLEQVD